MREIKFRAWDEQSKKMRDWDFFQALNVRLMFGTKSPFKVMQFTGLHDKNGKPIYEGDVVYCIATSGRKDTEDDNVRRTIVAAECGQWQTVQTGYFHGLPINWGGYESLEIIGNIYENPELIEKSV